MFGLSIVLVIFLYFGVTCTLALFLTRPLRLLWLRGCLVLTSLFAAATLPFFDEFQAEAGFRQLCQTQAKMDFDPETMRRKEILLDPSNSSIEILSLRVQVKTYRAFDASDNRYLGSYKAFALKGGWLARALFGPNASPLWIKRPFCNPAYDAQKDLDLNAHFVIR